MDALVTSAALILFLAFASMGSAPDTTVKVFATGLAAGIILDATIIRALLVPAVVSLWHSRQRTDDRAPLTVSRYNSDGQVG